MKAKCFGIVLVVGMLAASSANAWTFNRATYLSRVWSPDQLAASQASQTQPEVQVAVLANAAKPDVTAVCPTASIWFGSSANTHATHSR